MTNKERELILNLVTAFNNTGQHLWHINKDEALELEEKLRGTQ